MTHGDSGSRQGDDGELPKNDAAEPNRESSFSQSSMLVIGEPSPISEGK